MKNTIRVLGVIFLFLLATPADAKAITVEVNQPILFIDSINVTVITPEIIEIKVEDIYSILPTNSPQFRIQPKIYLNSSNDDLSKLTVEYIKKDKPFVENLKKENGMFIFDSPILVIGSPFYFPFDNYRASIYNISPPVLRIGEKDYLPITNDRYEGKAYFMNDKINFEITSSRSIIIKFVSSLIIYIIISLIYLNKANKQQLEKSSLLEAILGIILGVFGNYEYLYSIGFLIFIIIILIIVLRNYIIKLIKWFNETIRSLYL